MEKRLKVEYRKKRLRHFASPHGGVPRLIIPCKIRKRESQQRRGRKYGCNSNSKTEILPEFGIKEQRYQLEYAVNARKSRNKDNSYAAFVKPPFHKRKGKQCKIYGSRIETKRKLGNSSQRKQKKEKPALLFSLDVVRQSEYRQKKRQKLKMFHKYGAIPAGKKANGVKIMLNNGPYKNRPSPFSP